MCVVLLAAAGSPAGSSQPSDLAGHLFRPPESASARALDTGLRAASRSRVVGVAADRLTDDRLVLDLFEGRSVAARRQRAEPGPDGSWTWSGTVENEPLSAVTFVRVGDVVQGSIRSSTGAFSLEPLASGRDHVLRQVDSRQTAAELPPLVPPRARTLDASQNLSLDDGGTIDVFVVYTAAAREQAGGSDTAVKARIALGVAETNAAFANSHLAQRLRLVGSELVGYRESNDLSTDLRRLTADADGMMDEVHSRRRAVAADLVQLVVGSVAGGGHAASPWVAWAGNVSAAFAPYAFSVTAYPCISPNYTFGHELAHNMGTAHAPQDPNAPPAFPYAYGYKDPEQRFRTVMAYDCPSGCPRVLHFSNPAVSYDGQRDGHGGVAEQHPGAGPDRADRRQLRIVPTPRHAARRSLGPRARDDRHDRHVLVGRASGGDARRLRGRSRHRRGLDGRGDLRHRPIPDLVHADASAARVVLGSRAGRRWQRSGRPLGLGPAENDRGGPMPDPGRPADAERGRRERPHRHAGLDVAGDW